MPSSFWYEVFHGLTRLERRGIISRQEIEVFVADISQLDFSVDPTRDTTEMVELYRLSQRIRLNIYDAGYLELALRSGLPLVTNDKALTQAARNAGAALFEP